MKEFMHVRYGGPPRNWLASAFPLVLFAWAGFSPFEARAVSVASAQLISATHQLQAGDASGAIRMLKSAARHDPRSALTWRTLGAAYRQQKMTDQAIAAYRAALDIEPDSPQVFYALGILYASKADRDRSFQWLQRARSSRRYDMTQLSQDEEAKAMRSDSRYTDLLPKRDEFANPFVESVRILREWQGEAANDQFGWIARNIGDVDGDGINDIVTSAPTHGADGSHSGRIYVYSVGRNELLWTADGNTGDELGTGVEAAGDTNGDGTPDVVASGPAGHGIARLYSGRDGQLLHEFHALRSDELFGSHTAGAGDVDSDGYADVIVGSPGREGPSRSAGHAYVFSGKTGRLLESLSGERSGDQFGSTVAGYPDGREQYLIVGAPRAGPHRHGRVYVYAGGSRTPRFVIDSDPTGEALGAMFVSVAGDLNGDGVADIYASDWSNDAHGLSTGRVYVHSGLTGKRLLVLTGENEHDGFGTSPSVAGDVDGDGRADLIVGAWQYGKAAIAGGRAYLFSGRTGRVLRTYTDRVPGDTLGFDAVGLGDVDGDGIVDLLLTAAWSGINGYHSGRVFVVSSGVPRGRGK